MLTCPGPINGFVVCDRGWPLYAAPLRGHTGVKLTMRKYVVINPSIHQRAGQGGQVATALEREGTIHWRLCMRLNFMT